MIAIHTLGRKSVRRISAKNGTGFVGIELNKYVQRRVNLGKINAITSQIVVGSIICFCPLA